MYSKIKNVCIIGFTFLCLKVKYSQFSRFRKFYEYKFIRNESLYILNLILLRNIARDMLKFQLNIHFSKNNLLFSIEIKKLRNIQNIFVIILLYRKHKRPNI